VATKPKIIGTMVLSALLSVSMLRGANLQKSSTPKPHDKLALSEDEVKQLLLLMDTNKNGKISKQEFMTFMEAEFDRLDKNKSGELDPKELTQSQLRAARPFAHAGK
jgi:EF hand